MAASSASTVCLEATEVLGWFPDPARKKEVLVRFRQAVSATERHPAAWARADWAAACTDMRAVIQDPTLAELAFEMVCDFLDLHSKALEENPSNCKPGNRQPGGAKAKRQESADQQRSAWPDPRPLVEGEGNAPDLLAADVTLRAAPGTALQGARAPKKRAAPPLVRPEMKKPTEWYAAKLGWFHDQVLQILDRNPLMTFRAINKILKKADPKNSYNPSALWRRTNIYPYATALCVTRSAS
jgi:hypothetical protein